MFALGILGLIFPIIPGIVLLILSIAAFAKSSQKIRDHNLYIKYLEYMEKALISAKKIYIKNRKIIFRQAIIIVIVLGILVFAGLRNAQAASDLGSKYKQVKTVDSPIVYYLDYASGLKKAYASEAAFLAYGNKWSDIKIISESDLNKWSNVRLVKTKNSPAVYFIKNNQKALVKNEDIFLANNFKWSEVVTILPADLDTYQTVDFSQLVDSLAGGSINNYSGSINISLSDQSSNNNQIILGSKGSSLGIFRISAGSEGAAEIRSIKFVIKGIYRRDAVENLTLSYDGKVVADSNLNTANGEATFLFNDDPFLVLPGTYKELDLQVSTKYYPEWTSHNMKAVIESPSNISVNASVKGNFPIEGATCKLVYAENYLGKIKIEEEPLTRDNTAVIGNIEQELAKFKISEITKNEGLVISQLKFGIYGDIAPTDVANFVLKDKSGKKLAQVSDIKENQIVFNINKVGLTAGNSVEYSVYADIKDGVGKKINIQALNLDARGKNSEAGLPVEVVNLNNDLLVIRNMVGVYAKALTPSKNTFAKQNGVVLGVFEIRNNDQKIKLEEIAIAINKSASAPSLTKPLYLVNYNTGELLDVKNPDKSLIKFNLANLNLKGKDTYTLAFLTEIPDEAKQGDRYNIIFSSLGYQLATGNLYADAINLNGAQFTTSRSNVYVFANKDFIGSYTKGQKNLKIASFFIEAAAGEDTKIDSIILAKGDTSGLVTYDNGFSNLKLTINSSKVGSTITQPYSDSYVFNGFSYKLRGGEKYEVKVYADTAKDLKVSETQFMITSISATSYSSGITTVTNNINTKSNKTYFGALGLEVGLTNGGTVSAGTKNNIVGTFTVKNNGIEKASLKSVSIITSGNGFSNSLGYTYLQIIESSRAKTVGTVSRPVAGSNKVNLNYSLEPGQVANFNIVVTTSPNATIEAFLIYLSDIEAAGYSSKVSALVSGVPSSSSPVNIGAADNGNGSGNNATSTDIVFAWPVTGRITYGFGANISNGYPYGTHTGIDISVSQGTRVKAAYAGTVVETYDGGMVSASYIRISHNGNLETLYGHLSEIDVQVGDAVTQGQAIGLSGGTPGTPGAGSSTTGPHLHFEVRLNGVAVNPMAYLN